MILRLKIQNCADIFSGRSRLWPHSSVFPEVIELSSTPGLMEVRRCFICTFTFLAVAVLPGRPVNCTRLIQDVTLIELLDKPPKTLSARNLR